MELVRTHPEPTFKYFYIGFVSIIIGIWISTMYFAIGLCIILIGIFALLSVNGVIIDPNTKQVKAYFNFMFIKLGNWIPLSEFTHIVLGPIAVVKHSLNLVQQLCEQNHIQFTYLERIIRGWN